MELGDGFAWSPVQGALSHCTPPQVQVLADAERNLYHRRLSKSLVPLPWRCVPHTLHEQSERARYCSTQAWPRLGHGYQEVEERMIWCGTKTFLSYKHPVPALHSSCRHKTKTTLQQFTIKQLTCHSPLHSKHMHKCKRQFGGVSENKSSWYNFQRASLASAANIKVVCHQQEGEPQKAIPLTIQDYPLNISCRNPLYPTVRHFLTKVKVGTWNARSRRKRKQW